jgi:predicted outer membrane lipoprotein
MQVNRWVLGVLLALALCIVATAVLALRHQEATLLFFVVAAVSAPVVLHRVRSHAISVGLLIVLADFASFPAKKLYRIEETYGTPGEVAVTLAFLAILFLVGVGWRRDWTLRR